MHKMQVKLWTSDSSLIFRSEKDWYFRVLRFWPSVAQKLIIEVERYALADRS